MITKKKLREEFETVLNYAKPGEVYYIDKDAGVGYIYHPGTRPDQGQILFDAGTKIVLSPIPAALQKEFGVGETAIATCIETNNVFEDILELENGQRVFVSHFANLGIKATLATTEGASAPEAAEASV